MKRRVIVEVIAPGAHEGTQTTVEYDDSYSEDPESAVMDAVGIPSFEPIEGESNYEGWSRCTINISGPICTGGDCWNPLDAEEAEHGELCSECLDEVAA
jgi:hypothetical protein